MFGAEQTLRLGDRAIGPLEQIINDIEGNNAEIEAITRRVHSVCNSLGIPSVPEQDKSGGVSPANETKPPLLTQLGNQVRNLSCLRDELRTAVDRLEMVL